MRATPRRRSPAAGDEALRDEIVPGIRDPFKNTPVE